MITEKIAVILLSKDKSIGADYGKDAYKHLMNSAIYSISKGLGIIFTLPIICRSVSLDRQTYRRMLPLSTQQ